MRTFLKQLKISSPVGWSFLKEVDAGVGVADIVLVEKTARTAAAKRLRAVPFRLAPLFSPGVAAGITDLGAFMRATGTTRSSALRALKSLVEQRAASREGDRVVIKAVEERPYETVIAIEAKLRDWRRALVQAYRNRHFATQSWVVLDAHYRLSERAVDAFRAANVGLLLCGSDGGLRVLVEADDLEPTNFQRTWGAQAVIARMRPQPLRPSR